MSKRTKVSVVTITYNHEKYIRETLDSILAQQTNFTFELIIADDHSTDGTQAIVREYAAAHPDIIVPVLRQKNIGAQRNFHDALRRTKGKYIALCEGDDYWTDPHKLQLQTDYLDKHDEAALCFHPVRVFYETGEKPDDVFPDRTKKKNFTLTRLLRENYIQTNAVMYRRQKYDQLPDNVLPLDWYMHVYHAQFGKVGYIDKVMAAYRRHQGGLWWQASHDINEIWKKHGLAHLALFVEMGKLFNTQSAHSKIIDQHINDMLGRLADIDTKYHSHLFEDAMRLFPQTVKAFILSRIHRLQQAEVLLTEKEQHRRNLEGVIKEQADQINHLSSQLKAIHSSRVWKARNKIAKKVGKPEA